MWILEGSGLDSQRLADDLLQCMTLPIPSLSVIVVAFAPRLRGFARPGGPPKSAASERSVQVVEVGVLVLHEDAILGLRLLRGSPGKSR